MTPLCLSGKAVGPRSRSGVGFQSWYSNAHTARLQRANYFVPPDMQKKGSVEVQRPRAGRKALSSKSPWSTEAWKAQPGEGGSSRPS